MYEVVWAGACLGSRMIQLVVREVSLKPVETLRKRRRQSRKTLRQDGATRSNHRAKLEDEKEAT